MKILKLGQVKLCKKKLDPKYVGRVLLCRECKCRFKLDRSDGPKLQVDVRSWEKYVACPFCSSEVRIRFD